MKIKVKKLEHGEVKRVESRASINEVLSSYDILNPESAVIQVCFRGLNSSGILELSAHEAEKLSKSLAPLIKLKKKTKIFREKK